MNKKIRNATRKTVKGITFKSILEKTIYLTLLDNGIHAEYEPTTFVLWDGFKPIIPFYDRETEKQRDKRDILEGNDKQSSRQLILKDSKIVGIRYTPDFHFKYNDIDVYIEVKGIENDVFYIKKKMFIKYLDNRFVNEGVNSVFFEIYTKRQLLQALEILKNMKNSPTQRIYKMIRFLPKKDISLGYRFLEQRDLSSLQELVDSAIVKVYKNIRNESHIPEYDEVSIDDLQILKSEVDSYVTLLTLETGYDEEAEYSEDYEDYSMEDI